MCSKFSDESNIYFLARVINKQHKRRRCISFDKYAYALSFSLCSLLADDDFKEIGYPDFSYSYLQHIIQCFFLFKNCMLVRKIMRICSGPR